ncbi:efflux RND transporter permease subunit [Exilibacterium tricleocarpae]|uniref:Efflux RND transporter permease subunit n=1 Tax=Exilibacterium tricleocarpae TaxID=2591008 RepID=A0A545TLL8_9GAMM|nr:efflux RND transporter permease subunit [Exilibacterium tricleocarpae]TQV78051.1 efflux RND transporter permease subunit [Exilibacterium tricleocarpae]
MSNLVRFFIERPKLVNLIMILVILLGLSSLQASRYEVTPHIDMGVVTVTTTKAGAGPEEVELSISLVLEEELLKVNGVRKIFSRSMEGLSLITLNLDPDYPDKRKVLADIQKAVDRAQSRLPSDLIEKPLVEELGTDNLPVAELHITGAVSEDILRQQARHWQQVLRTVAGVSGIEKIGYRRPEIAIQLDQHKLLQLGVSIDEIKRAIALRNIRDSGGSISSLSSEKKVLTVGQFEDPLEVARLIVRSREPGNSVLLRDIATVLPDYEDWEVQVRTDGQLGIALQIKKLSTADELATLERVRELLASEKERLPGGVELHLVNDISRFTKDMLKTLVANAWMGFVSVFLILWLFLGRRLALWVSIGLPFSILATFAILLFTGFSINSLTLMSLILVLGMLVDDAIVSAESIQARRESGLSRKQAAIKGTQDVAAPVFVSVLTTILAFLPLFTLGGLEGDFVLVIPVVITLMLLASLFESKFLLPAHLAHSAFKTERRSWLVYSQQRYQQFILLLLRHRKKASAAIVLMFLTIITVSASQIRFQLYPDTAVDTINIQIELPNGTPFADTGTRVSALENAVRAVIPATDLLNIVSQIGHQDTDIYGGSEGRNQAWAVTTVYLKPSSEVQEPPAATLAKIKALAARQTDFVSIRVEPLKDTPVMGKPVELEIMSDGTEKLQVADAVKAFLVDLPGVTRVWDSQKTGKDILDLTFNYHNLAGYHLTVKQVAEAVRVAMDGLIVAEQQLAAERTYFRLSLPREGQKKLNTLKDLFIINSRGEAVALNSVASFSLRPGDTDIKHYAGRRTVTVYADIDRAATDVLSVNQHLREHIMAQNWGHQYPGMSFHQGGELEQQQQSYGNLGVAFFACILMILFVLVVLFNSFSQPLLILAVLPFSVMGVLVAFAVQDLPMSFIAMIGVLGLVGVLVNDAVVMVYSLNREKSPTDLGNIAKRAATRFRPIVITSITTVVGLFPTAYGWGGENPFVAPMVMAMVWGVLFGTLISLLLLPCLYVLNEDARLWLRRKVEQAIPAPNRPAEDY